jgi:anti-sigma regulatory factor (Ser/Thr protein kinase)
VEAHLKHCPRTPIRVALTDESERFEVVVTDAAAGEVPAELASSPVTPDIDGVVHQLPPGVGLAVISGLADEVRISPAGDGTSVAMTWKRRTEVP